MPKLDIAIDRWLPDLLPFAMPKGGLITCKNLIPFENNTYKIMPSQIAYSTNAMTGTPLSGEEFYANDSIYYTFIGTDVGMWRIGPGNTLSDVTRVSGAYTTSGNRWYFAKYSDWIVATNFNDPIQVIKGMTASNFEPLLTDTTIKAKYCVQNHGHLLLGYVIHEGVTYPNGVLISSKDLITDFTTVGKADFVNLEECPSPITSMLILESADAGNESNIAIFHEDNISVAWWTGSPFYFSFDYSRYRGIGAISGTPVMANGRCYFFDEKSIYRWDGVSTPEDIGDGVRERILNFLDIGYYYRITAATHPRYGLVVWSFVSIDKTIPNYLLILNTRNNKFTLVETTQYCIFSMHKNEWTINQLGDFFPAIDEIPYPTNSNFWSDNSATFACVGTDKKINIFQGEAMDWEIETGEYFTDRKEIIRASRAYPMVQERSSNIEVSFGGRFEKNEEVVYATSTTRDNGYADLIKSGRFLRTRLRGGMMDGITGIEVEGEIIGRH